MPFTVQWVSGLSKDDLYQLPVFSIDAQGSSDGR